MDYKIIVIINEQHTLTTEQEAQILALWSGYETLKVPAAGWTFDEMNAQAKAITASYPHAVVFVSPVPYLLARLARRERMPIFVFHNDRREKVERDGKISYRIPADGWELVEA
ncbi:MAG: hypothetical protein ACOYYS_10065 [Chloroflexota bacterium]